jgi:hypothetical protein
MCIPFYDEGGAFMILSQLVDPAQLMKLKSPQLREMMDRVNAVLLETASTKKVMDAAAAKALEEVTKPR